jgi:hypothetical protein
MAQQKWLHDMALVMLNDYRVTELPLDLRNFLDDVEDSANTLQGSIQSRQVVALALATYKRLKRLEDKVSG